MNIDQLHYFIIIAEEGSVIRAARRLNVTRQTLSKYLRGLQEQYQTEFFRKSGASLVLTEAGVRFLDAARAISDLMEQTRGLISRVNESYTINLGVTHKKGLPTICACVEEFSRLYPDVYLQIHDDHTQKMIHDLRNDLLDLCFITTSETVFSGCDVLPLYRAELYLAMADHHEYILAHPELQDFDCIDLEDVINYTFCTTSDPESFPYKVVKHLLDGHSNRIRYLSNSTLVEAYIRSGLELGFLPFREDSGMRYFRIGEPVNVYHSLMTRTGKELSVEERKILELYCSHFMDDPTDSRWIRIERPPQSRS